MGMIERQHRSIKDSLKASIQDMADKHQSKWMDFLPFVVLGKNSAVQPDIGASPNELAFGSALRLPGQLLQDPGQIQSDEDLKDLLQEVRKKTANPAVQPSRHSPLEKPLPEIPANVTHVYTRQHKTTGLQPPFEGPFRIASRPSRSTVKLEVGIYNNGEARYEIRHLNDLRLAHPESLVAPAVRPKLGRPSAVTSQSDVQIQTETPTNSNDANNQNRFPQPSQPSTLSENKQTGRPAELGKLPANNHETSNPTNRVPASGSGGGSSTRPVRVTRNPNPQYVDALEVQWSSLRPWSATPSEISKLNKLIGG